MADENCFKTEQEAFWAGLFGTDYIARNQGDSALASGLALFAQALKRIEEPSTCMEFGANIGLNLDALRLLYPNMDQYAVEINAKAAAILRKKLPDGHVFGASIFDYRRPDNITFDLVLIKGVLIHLNPAYLEQAYAKLYEATGRYLLVCEYYNPTPISVTYRGHSERLFKRDFAGEIMDRYRAFKLLDYGFVYHRDYSFPQDDLTWFLMEKR